MDGRTSIRYDGDDYILDADDNDRYLALYWCYFRRHADGHERASDALGMLYTGSEYGDLADVAVLDRQTGEILYQNSHPERSGYFEFVENAWKVRDTFDAIDVRGSTRNTVSIESIVPE